MSVSPLDEFGERRSAEEIARLEELERKEEEFNRQRLEEEADREAALARQRENGRGKGGRRGDLVQKVTYLPDIHRLLPQAPDAEQGILSSALLAPREILGLCDAQGVKADWFHSPARAIVWDALKALEATGAPIDFISLTQFMRDKVDCGTSWLDAAGGAAAVTDIFTFLPTAANAPYYIEVAWEKFILREIIKSCTELAARAYDEQDQVPELFARAEELLIAITEASDKQGGLNKRPTKIKDAVARVLETIHAGKTDETWGLSTGYPNLDAVARGLRPANMIAIGGETSAGKTALALNIVHNVCVKGGHPALIFSLEMTTEEVTEVLLQAGSGVNVDAARERRIGDNEWKVLAEASARLEAAPLIIRDDKDVSILQARSIARRIRPRLIVLDYAQLFTGGKKKYERSDLEIADISRSAKKMAGELGATVLILTQLNDDGKVAGSRTIAKDADQLWIVTEGDGENRQVQICKQRRGAKDKVDFRFIGPATKFLAKTI